MSSSWSKRSAACNSQSVVSLVALSSPPKKYKKDMVKFLQIKRSGALDGIDDDDNDNKDTWIPGYLDTFGVEGREACSPRQKCLF
jgi:hypothetical protein